MGLLHTRSESLKTKESRKGRNDKEWQGWRSNQNMCTIVCVCVCVRGWRMEEQFVILILDIRNRLLPRRQLFFTFYSLETLRNIWVSLFGFHNAVIKDLSGEHAWCASYITDCTALRGKVQYHTDLEWLHKTNQGNKNTMRYKKKSDQKEQALWNMEWIRTNLLSEERLINCITFVWVYVNVSIVTCHACHHPEYQLRNCGPGSLLEG